MKNIQTLLALIIVVIVFSGSAYFYGTEKSCESVAVAEDETLDPPEVRARELFEYTNEARGEGKHLKWNDCLANKATERAEEIASTGNLSHEDSEGNAPAKAAIAGCFEDDPVKGENLAEGQTTGYQAHFEFMQSPGHRENILKEDFSDMGVGCFEDVCVQFFSG